MDIVSSPTIQQSFGQFSSKFSLIKHSFSYCTNPPYVGSVGVSYNSGSSFFNYNDQNCGVIKIDFVVQVP